MLIKCKSGISIVGSVASLLFFSSAFAEQNNVVNEGKQLAFDRTKGNCLACHMIGDGDLPGNLGPPLMVMNKRYPDFEKLVQHISNPLTANPNSSMPPFGLHGILTDQEIRKIAEYLYTL